MRCEHGQPPRRAVTPGCLGCGAPLATASLLAPFCDACLQLLGESGREMTPAPRHTCEHCGGDFLTLFGGGKHGLCQRCSLEASAVLSHGAAARERALPGASCSFCNQPASRCEFLLAGPSIFVCAACIDLASWLESTNQEQGPCPPGATCSFSGSAALEKLSFFSSASGTLGICNECVDLAREVIEEHRRARRSSMRVVEAGSCDGCGGAPEKKRIQVASGAALCERCVHAWFEKRVSHGVACERCGDAEDVAGVMLGSQENPRCPRCFART